jgi:hypothetical protein
MSLADFFEPNAASLPLMREPKEAAGRLSGKAAVRAGRPRRFRLDARLSPA